MSKVYVPAYGPIGAKLMILGECPSPQDVEAGKPLADSAGKELDRILRDVGINRSECWVSNVCKYHVTGSVSGEKKIPFGIRAQREGVDFHQELQDLQQEINSIKPNCILALGGTALYALSGKNKISKFRGSILHGMGVKFVPTYHPRDLMHSPQASEIKGYWNRVIMMFDFKRALKQSQFPELNLPHRTLEICRNSHQLAEFFKRYKHLNRAAVDIEAMGSGLPACIGIAFTKGHGITVPLWNTNGISEIPDSDMVQIWILLADFLANTDIVGQNFNYDRDKLLRLGFIIKRLASDTMFKAFAINPELPKGLAFQTSLYTEEPFYKDEGMYEGTVNDLLMGCARDSCVTFEIDENMDADLDEIHQRSFYENYLMHLPDMYWDIERQGFRIDAGARDKLLYKYIEWDERLRHRLFQLTGTEINVNSPKQIGSLLWDNYGLPRKYSTGEESITELLNSPTAIKSDDVREVCELILEDRRVRKSISTYLMAMPDFDGRMRTTYFACLDTGRSSTGQQDPPIRPEVEVYDENGKKKKKVLGIAFQTMTKHGDIGADIREMYIPDEEDEVFVQADSSQAEARVVWLLADDEEALRLVDEIDYHAWTATWFFGGIESDYSKKVLGYEHPIRFAGKTLRHAGHLGAGKRRASIEVNTQARKYKVPIQISESIAERALKIFHAKQPKIQSVFQASVIECLRKNRTLIAPIPWGLDVEFGGRRTFYERWNDELFRQGFSYLPQRAVTDNTKAAGLRIRRRCPGIKIVMESHDALLFCMKISMLRKWTPIIKQEFERPIDFSRCSIPRRSLVIPCDIETGVNYCNLSKFKDIPIISKPAEELRLTPKSITEQFAVVDLLKDSKLTDIIYQHQMRSK
jgi:uracil-DNA glycosylase family 4